MLDYRSAGHCDIWLGTWWLTYKTGSRRRSVYIRSWKWLCNKWVSLGLYTYSNKSQTWPTEQTPKPEYLITLATYLGVRWWGPIQYLMDIWELLVQSAGLFWKQPTYNLRVVFFRWLFRRILSLKRVSLDDIPSVQNRWHRYQKVG